ncbi:melatonin receptor type 1B isoform X2 [Haemorhous mexicanus]|uniref:melatonin receptor type 1B isoform X2 n=1 Tax=Haemorhous mexicanus TaxID=30427 RepID=UPI0028BD2F7B|nr:melatonin receptor type 1B isoform X2 [Haemorhous mexicanus]
MLENGSLRNCCDPGGRGRLGLAEREAAAAGAPRPAWVVPVLSSVLIFTTVVDILGNLLVILSVFRNRKLRNSAVLRSPAGWSSPCGPPTEGGGPEPPSMGSCPVQGPPGAQSLFPAHRLCGPLGLHPAPRPGAQVVQGFLMRRYVVSMELPRKGIGAIRRQKACPKPSEE